MYSLYIHTNKLNNKKYIGITKQIPSYRWKNGLGYKKSPKFFNAIVKYGWDNFNHEVIYNDLTKEQAEKLEKEYIEKYKTTSDEYGYNLQKGGGITDISEIARLHLKLVNTGKKASPETRKKISESLKGKQKCLGYKHTEETKEKHRQLWLGTKNCRSRAVIQYDLNGKFIKRYDYMQQAVNELGLSSSSHISMCCNGKRHKCNGYIWKYEEQEG